MHAKRACPLIHLAEMQAHQGVGIVDGRGSPGLYLADDHADLFLEFAAQGLLDVFP